VRRTASGPGTHGRIADGGSWHAREQKGRRADPTLVVIDNQSVHAAASVPAETTGKDPAKKVPGRKRCLAVDVLGLVIAVVVLAAPAHDNTVGIALLDKVATQAATVRTALVDQGFKSQVVAHGATMGIDVQVVERQPAGTPFFPIGIDRRPPRTRRYGGPGGRMEHPVGAEPGGGPCGSWCDRQVPAANESRADQGMPGVGCVLLWMNARRSALTWSWCVAVMP
jgi:hypothetical protein